MQPGVGYMTEVAHPANIQVGSREFVADLQDGMDGMPL